MAGAPVQINDESAANAAATLGNEVRTGMIYFAPSKGLTMGMTAALMAGAVALTLVMKRGKLW